MLSFFLRDCARVQEREVPQAADDINAIVVIVVRLALEDWASLVVQERQVLQLRASRRQVIHEWLQLGDVVRVNVQCGEARQGRKASGRGDAIRIKYQRSEQIKPFQE
jgi:hypothetical protein